MSAGTAPPAAAEDSTTSKNWKMTNKYSRVCVTINLKEGEEHNADDIKLLVQLLKPDFIVVGKETSPTTNRRHYQGYFELSKRKEGTTINNIFRKIWGAGYSIHFEAAMGTAEQNIKYCTKEDKDAHVYGEPTGNNGPGSRTDLHAIFKQLKEGASLETIAETNPGMFLQHYKGFQFVRNMFRKHNQEPRTLIFLWGPTRTGKSCHARELNPELVHYESSFFRGYTGDNPIVLFDDFEWEKMNPKVFLQMTDRYDMVANVKGGETKWNPHTIIFTSNDDPKTWWKDCPPATLEAVHRRMDEFGTTKYLGTLVPHTTKILKDFFKPRTQTSATTAHPEPTTAPQEELPATLPLDEEVLEDTEEPAQRIPSPRIIDLTGDTDEEVRSTTTGKVIFSAKRGRLTDDEEDASDGELSEEEKRKIKRLTLRRK